jgi:hypothetical protein
MMDMQWVYHLNQLLIAPAGTTQAWHMTPHEAFIEDAEPSLLERVSYISSTVELSVKARKESLAPGPIITSYPALHKGRCSIVCEPITDVAVTGRAAYQCQMLAHHRVVLRSDQRTNCPYCTFYQSESNRWVISLFSYSSVFF